MLQLAMSPRCNPYISLCGPRSEEPYNPRPGRSSGLVFTVAVGRPCATLWRTRTSFGVLAGLLLCEICARRTRGLFPRRPSTSTPSAMSDLPIYFRRSLLSIHVDSAQPIRNLVVFAPQVGPLETLEPGSGALLVKI